MAPDTSKVDPDCRLDPGPSARNFRDEMLWFVYGEQSFISKDLLIPIYRYLLHSRF